MKIVKVKQKSAEVERLCSRGVAPTEEIYAKVREILSNVKKGGLPQVVAYAQKFDGLQGNKLRITETEIKKVAAKADPALQKGLKQAIKNVKLFHENQCESSWLMEGKNGEVLGQRIRPMHRVGLYVPGGAAIYPSTVIMNAVPALVAGVEEIVVTTPAKEGLQPAVAFVLQELGITEVYHVGGAQAIGLLLMGPKELSP